MKKYIFVKIITLIITLLIPFLNIIGQNDVSGLKDQDFNSNMLSFHIGAPLLNNLTIHNQGKPLLKSKYTFAPLFEMEFGKLVYRTFGIKAGAGFNFVPFNTNFSFNVEQENGISGDFNESQYEYNIVNFSFYFLLNKLFVINSKNSVSTEIGIKYNYISKNSLPIYISYSYFDQDNDTSLDLLSFYIYQNTNCYSLIGNINFLHSLSKKSILIIVLTFNYSPSYIAAGDYYFSNLPWESSGLVELGINYFGVKVGYGLTF